MIVIIGCVSGNDQGSEQGDVRRRLLVAATEVVAERGYDRAGVAEIARRAGLTTGAIYSRYRGIAKKRSGWESARR